MSLFFCLDCGLHKCMASRLRIIHTYCNAFYKQESDRIRSNNNTPRYTPTVYLFAAAQLLFKRRGSNTLTLLHIVKMDLAEYHKESVRELSSLQAPVLLAPTETKENGSSVRKRIRGCR